MKRIFITGDDTFPLYHPYSAVAGELESVFEGFAIAGVSEHFEAFELEDYRKYDLVILYSDHWVDKSPTVHQQVQALASYVASGGALLVLHNPDCGVDVEMAHLIGMKPRKPLEQPDMTELKFRVDRTHPVGETVPDFSLREEVFALEYAPFTERSVFLEAALPLGDIVPAGWTTEYGCGRAAYLSPGHDAASFREPAYRSLLLRAARWLTKQSMEGENDE